MQRETSQHIDAAGTNATSKCSASKATNSDSDSITSCSETMTTYASSAIHKCNFPASTVHPRSPPSRSPDLESLTKVHSLYGLEYRIKSSTVTILQMRCEVAMHAQTCESHQKRTCNSHKSNSSDCRHVYIAVAIILRNDDCHVDRALNSLDPLLSQPTLGEGRQGDTIGWG